MSLAERLQKLNLLRRKVKETEELRANSEKLRRENEEIAGRLILENTAIRCDLQREKSYNEKFKINAENLMTQKEQLESRLKILQKRIESEKERGIIPIRQNKLKAEAELWELKKKIEEIAEKMVDLKELHNNGDT